MWGVLLVPSSSPTLSPIYDGLDVNVASNVTWFRLNHDMVSRRIYKQCFFYGGHSTTVHPFSLPRLSHSHVRGTVPDGQKKLTRGTVPDGQKQFRCLFRHNVAYHSLLLLRVAARLRRGVRVGSYVVR